MNSIGPMDIEAIEASTKGGQNKTNIYITIDCFKTMCMIVNNDMGLGLNVIS